MPRAFLVKKNKFRPLCSEKSRFYESEPEMDNNSMELEIDVSKGSLTPSLIQSDTATLPKPQTASTTPRLNPTNSSGSFPGFRFASEEVMKNFRLTLASIEKENEENKAGVDLQENKQIQPRKSATLNSKELAPLNEKYGEFPKPKGPLSHSQFLCQLCKEVYSDPFSLAQHKCSGIQHTEYRCPECDKVFSCPANLASHRRWHRPRSRSPQEPLPISPQLEQPSIPENLKMEEMDVSHPADSQDSAQGHFVCEVCKKTFRRKAYLRKHLNNHSDDRPYPCQYCGKVFRSLTNRAKHVLNHAVGPKTFTCNICGNGFANKGSLDRHARIHTGEIYSCKHCSSTFYSSPGLTRHTNKCHPSEGRQVIVLQVPVRQG